MKKRSTNYWQTFRFLVGFKLTPVGRFAVLGIFLSAVGAITVEVPIYQIFCSLICLFGTIELVGILMRPKLRVAGFLQVKVTAGDTVQGYITVENAGVLPACDIMCTVFGLPQSMRHIDGYRVISELAHNQLASIPVTIEANRRGEFVLPDIRVHSTFPFNLMRFGKAKVEAHRLTVLPHFHRLEDFRLPFSMRYQPGGIALENRLGDSPEYIGNREYVAGEPVRRLDFRAWARVGKPVVKEYQDEYCSRVAIVLDTHRSGFRFPATGFKDLEAAISITAAIADALNVQETLIDVFAAGPDLFLFQTTSGTTHFDSVMEILAAVEHSKQNPFDKLSPVIAESLESISTVVCVLLDWDASREELVRRMQEAGCSVRVILVRAKPTTLPFHVDEENFSQHLPQEILDGGVRVL